MAVCWPTCSLWLIVTTIVLSAASIGLLFTTKSLVLTAPVLKFNYSSHGTGPECVGKVFAASGVAGIQLDGFNSTEWIPSPRTCQDLTLHALPPDQEYLAQWTPRSRDLPPRLPELCTFNWEGQAQRPSEWPPRSQHGACSRSHWVQPEVIKIYQGVIYSAVPHNSSKEGGHKDWRPVREIIYEMLLTVLWLYKDVPDMDLLVNYLDGPIDCNPGMPVLQFSVLNTTSPATGEQLDLDPDYQSCPEFEIDPHFNRSQCAGHVKGFAIPMWHTWEILALSPQHLMWYSYCLHTKYLHSIGSNDSFACSVPRKAATFWRGSPTGSMHGWSRAAWNTSMHARYNSVGDLWWAQFLLYNKRCFLALLSDRYAWMDVGITYLQHPATNDTGNCSIKAYEVVGHAVRRDIVPLEQWNKHHLVMQIDGHGFTERLSRLLLGNVPVVKVETMIREWFAHEIIPGVHYEPVSFDLSDVVQRTRSLVREAAQRGRRLERMAAAALQLGTRVLNGMAQTEAIAWAMARSKEACPWQVRPPASAVVGGTGDSGAEVEVGWHVVKLPRDRRWVNPTVSLFKDSIMGMLHHNFE